MKNIKYTTLACLLLLSFTQTASAQETYGKTLNLGVGLGYYGYVNHSIGVLQANYEFDVAKNFTLAPFIGYYSYTSYHYWGNKNYPYRNYRYHETVIPIGVKGSYYFDDLLHAGNKWDFYLGASLGFAIIRARWDADYYGDKYAYRTGYRGSSPLYLDIHAGAEYHVNKNIGLFLDLSSGVSSFGLAIHH